MLQSDVVVLIALVLGMGIGGCVGALIGMGKRRRVPDPRREEEEVVKVKRTKPSLRNPMRPYSTQYDDFKTKRGLYEPVRSKGRTREQKDELEV